ncbi:MAG: hypothetical protein NVSMB49_04950 [Ktedonobacteraceae bacterium]
MSKNTNVEDFMKTLRFSHTFCSSLVYAVVVTSVSDIRIQKQWTCNQENGTNAGAVLSLLRRYI